jgi:hypothetical protein
MKMCGENSDYPILILRRYQILGENGKVLVDYSNDFKQELILRMDDFEIAELTEVN